MWNKVAEGVLLFRDSCNVYALEAAEGLILVNAGSGRWLEQLEALPGKPVALLCTHYFRDHAARAVAAARSGIPIYIPEGEEAVFADPVQHFRQRETATLQADAHAEVTTMLAIVPSGTCRRQPFAVELTADGHCFGQVAEALATIGCDRF